MLLGHPTDLVSMVVSIEGFESRCVARPSFLCPISAVIHVKSQADILRLIFDPPLSSLVASRKCLLA